MTKDTMTRFTFRMPKAMFLKLKVEASSMGVSINSLMLQILWEWAKSNPTDTGQSKRMG